MRRSIAREKRSAVHPSAVGERYPHYVDAVGRLAVGVARASGAPVIVDSSKTLRHACVLMATGEVELRVLHLVRDPRGAVFSMVQRPKARLDDPGGSSMLNPDLESAVMMWLKSNWESELLSQHAEHSMFLRYEDMVRAPARTIEKVVGFAGERRKPPQDSEAIPIIKPSHTISGNPDRLSGASRERIALDDEWSSSMDPLMRAFIEEKTSDWIRKYGYA